MIASRRWHRRSRPAASEPAASVHYSPPIAEQSRDRAPLPAIQEGSYPALVKATIDIPDDLYHKVRAKSALAGRPVREVAIELFRRWLEEDATPAEQTAEQWLEEWLRLADETMRDAPPGPTARELLEQDRSRLEPR
jgi:hypothetical protein